MIPIAEVLYEMDQIRKLIYELRDGIERAKKKEKNDKKSIHPS